MRCDNHLNDSVNFKIDSSVIDSLIPINNFEASYQLFKMIREELKKYTEFNSAIVLHGSYVGAIVRTGLGFHIADPKTIWKDKIICQVERLGEKNYFSIPERHAACSRKFRRILYSKIKTF